MYMGLLPVISINGYMILITNLLKIRLMVKLLIGMVFITLY